MEKPKETEFLKTIWNIHINTAKNLLKYCESDEEKEIIAETINEYEKALAELMANEEKGIKNISILAKLRYRNEDGISEMDRFMLEKYDRLDEKQQYFVRTLELARGSIMQCKGMTDQINIPKLKPFFETSLDALNEVTDHLTKNTDVLTNINDKTE